MKQFHTRIQVSRRAVPGSSRHSRPTKLNSFQLSCVDKLADELMQGNPSLTICSAYVKAEKLLEAQKKN